MYCSNCGLKLQEFSKFCSSCGESVSEIPDKNIQNSNESEESINILSEYPIENLTTDQITNPKNTPSEQDINYSGFWRRAAAGLVDYLILTIPGLILFYFMDYAMYFNPLFWIFLFLFGQGYQFYFFKKYNATPGKIFVGLKIIPIDLTIKHLDTKTIILRQMGALLSVLVFFIGFLIQPFNKKKRAMHDFIAGTVVIDEKKRSSWMIFTIIIASYITFTFINLKVAPFINPELFIDIQNATNQVLHGKNDGSNLPDVNTAEDLPSTKETPPSTAPQNSANSRELTELTKDKWLGLMRAGLPSAFCTSEQIFRQCFSVSELQCKMAATAATDACIKKYEKRIPKRFNSAKESKDLGSELGICAGNTYGFILRKQLINSNECKGLIPNLPEETN
jgi:uncharacterized RDD family membrane protein YckC